MAAVAQEFHISVTPLGTQDEYLVRIERVAPGVLLAEERVIWPVEDWLAQARQLMNDPLFLLLQGQQGYENNLNNSLGLPATNAPLNLVTLGEQLYNALFQGSIRDSWMMAQAIAQNQRSILRLRLGLKGTYLPRLPWEVLHAGDRPLATGADVTFSRYQLSTTSSRISIPTYSQNQAVKILMVISGPTDQETLALKQEAYHLQAELKNRNSQSSLPIQLKILEQPGREQITQALEHNHYQVFHYAGHSNLGAAGGDLYLVSGKTGLTETLSGDDLAGLLVNNGIQLAVFNSCRGADTATSTDIENGREQNLAYALVKRGIPGVLAMAERIPDEVALTLTSLFYRNLNRGYPIDLSLSRARQGLISAYGSNQLYWALPVLYLHPQFDGFLTNSADSKELAQRLTIPDPTETLFVAEEIESREIKNSSNRPSNYATAADFDEDLGISEAWIDEDEQNLIVPGRSHASFVNYDRFDDEDDESDLLDDLDYDISYEEDSAVVADLFRHISQSDPTIKQPLEQIDSPLLSPSGTPNSQAEATTKLSSLSTPQTANATAAIASTIVPQSVSVETPVNPQSPPEQPPKIQWQVTKKDKRRGILLPLIGATSLIAIAASSFWYWQRSIQLPDVLPEFNQSASVPQLPKLNKSDLKAAKTAAVTTVAIEQFSQNNLDAGIQAVEELLDRNALNQAKAALANVPKKDRDIAAVNFLQGRLAWQSVQAGDKEYSIDDARRYWEFALKNEPNSTLYRNALGFAYYTESKFAEANQVWFDALYLSPKNQSEIASKDTLTTYAALSIGLKQLAKTQSSEKQAKLLSESTKLRQKVISDDPVNFQPDALSKNWLWSEKAIQDWRSLLQAQS